VDDRECLDRAPKIRMLRVPLQRIRFSQRDEVERLVAAPPEHLAAMASFTLALRRDIVQAVTPVPQPLGTNSSQSGN
jgi:hypothetical protein